VAEDGLASGLVLARRYVAAQQFENALDALAKCGDQALEVADYWFLRAESSRRLERCEEAVAAAREGLRRWPEDIGLLDVLGLSLVDLGDLANGDAVYRTALELVPEHCGLLTHHALALAKLGKTAEARQVVATVMELAPDSVGAVQVRAQVAYLTKDKLAGQYIEELLAADPESRVGHVLSGNLALRKRKARPAAQSFAEAARLDPANNSVAKAARETRIASHPLLRPAAPILLLGSRRARFVYLVVILALFSLGQQGLAYIFMVLWLVFMVVTPRVLRARYRSKYGDI
jgi:tetratricopeptide (TPR) repeat protein